MHTPVCTHTCKYVNIHTYANIYVLFLVLIDAIKVKQSNRVLEQRVLGGLLSTGGHGGPPEVGLLSRGLNELKESSMCVSRGEMFWTEGPACAKAWWWARARSGLGRTRTNVTTTGVSKGRVARAEVMQGLLGYDRERWVTSLARWDVIHEFCIEDFLDFDLIFGRVAVAAWGG